MLSIRPWWDNLDSADRFMYLRIVFWSWLLASIASFLLARSTGQMIWLIFVVNPLAAATFGAVVFGILNRLAAVAVHSLAGGGGDPYEVGYSEQDAMVVRGEWQKAVASYHTLLRNDPANSKVRLRLARLLRRNGADTNAVEGHYLKVRQHDLSGSHEAEVSNALIDLYRAEARHEDLRRELMRSAQRDAGTPRGDGARRALRELALRDHQEPVE